MHRILTFAALALGLVAAAASPALAGGPNVVHRDRVLANTNDVYNMTFRGGETAEIGVVGDHDTDLDLLVYDENGNLIASDTDYSDNCFVSWVPKWTGNFKVKIVNRGNVYNDYTVAAN